MLDDSLAHQAMSQVPGSISLSSTKTFCSGAGLLILLTIIVITTNLRLIVENILKYGVLTRPQAWVLALVPRSNPMLLLSWVAMGVCILMSCIIENVGASRLKAERKVSQFSVFHWMLAFTCITFLREILAAAALSGHGSMDPHVMF